LTDCAAGTDDPLIALFERTAAEAQEAGLTEAKIKLELAAYNAERRAWAFMRSMRTR